MKFQLKIITPSGEFYNGESSLVHVMSSEGYLTILPGHMPLVTMINTAPLEFVNKDNVRELCSCSSGMIYVTRTEVTLLVRSVEYKKDIDLERAKKALERAETQLHVETSDFKRAELALKRALNRINIAEKK